jgi:phosphoglycolate phosphatase-like HAD superfamily hydrolase
MAGAAVDSAAVRVLALDFDGVVCDSVREVLATALATYESMVPGSRLVETLRSRLGGGRWHALELRDDPVAAAFGALMPLGNRAEDFGVALRALEESAAIEDQASYDAFFASLPEAWKHDFHRRFYEHREAAAEHDLDGWIALHASYPWFLDLLRRHADDARLALATAKDLRSARLLLDHLGIGDLFAPELVLDKEAGRDKTAHLTAIRDRAGVEPAAVTFVDDKVNHLLKVAPLGVRPILAGWGFNTRREHELARRFGFAVANTGDADRVLYGGGT